MSIPPIDGFISVENHASTYQDAGSRRCCNAGALVGRDDPVGTVMRSHCQCLHVFLPVWWV
ncbi:hypothetical protein HETIRDRAFT_173027 [Heterobasidion irregulare TC 32-1]|uniref:Uncharacterized protein n=1 Tax=Heterobasidion irregulare (strain TC 32-1) TaxID=747525 RepID=W4K693_HETIT|nr:uncharacterized protein HETIRDRAFT_173027 [Heterobasidion irregulare TC 32-1]ETW81342.1 hypothetical protein HETIRDRAFT_173027 [Heterobasidion irregulare TC 32-1]